MATVELQEVCGMYTLRVTCHCRDLSHNLDIVVDETPEDISSIEVNTAEHNAFHYGFWGRLGAAFDLLRGKKICCGGIVLTKSDLRDIAKFIETHVQEREYDVC